MGDRATEGLRDFMDEHEGRPKGSSSAGINKERVRQGYKKEKMTGTMRSTSDGFMKASVSPAQQRKPLRKTETFKKFKESGKKTFGTSERKELQEEQK